MFAAVCSAPLSAQVDTIRLALWHAPFSREGPGLLVRDLQKRDAALQAMANALETADADIIALTNIDFDASGTAVRLIAGLVGGGHDFHVALRSNGGIPTGRDLDADGRLGEPEDAQAYARFPGQGALAVLSRFPIQLDRMRSFNDILWEDLPGTHMIAEDTGRGVQRLSSGGHWSVPVSLGDGVHLTVLIGHAGPPVFDGPEDRNGRRNLDELRLWEMIVSGAFGPFGDGPAVFMADTNLDPLRGGGYRKAMADFLSFGPFQDPMPEQATAMWDRPGPMRVSYLLPDKGLIVSDSRVWPLLPDQDHRLITVDIVLPDGALP